MKLFVHKKTVRYYDYGALLETVTGISWSTDGKPENATGFERGMTVEAARAKFTKVATPSNWELLEGPAVERSHDMNPHGFI